MKVLALGAHPDDIEIYMFGALCAYAARGDELAFAIATDGSKGGKGDPGALSRLRKQEASDAAALIGVTPQFLDFPDGELVPDRELVMALKALFARECPELVITHAPNDYHGDHRALSEAARLASSFSVPVLHADNLRGVAFEPTYYIDVSAHFETKLAAIRCHDSQSPERFVEACRQLNGFRGQQANQANATVYAEAFRFEPAFPFVDIRDLLPPAPPVRAVVNRAET